MTQVVSECWRAFGLVDCLANSICGQRRKLGLGDARPFPRTHFPLHQCYISEMDP